MSPGQSKIQVLQVDDDLLFNTVFAQHFKQHAEKVELSQVLTIADAEKRLAETPEITWLVLDLSLPDRDGFEYIKSLGEAEVTLKVAIVSSQPPSVIQMANTMAESVGVNVVLSYQKPLTPEKLAKLDSVILST